MPSLSQSLSLFANTFTFEMLPPAIRTLVGDHFLDTLSCCLAGCHSESYDTLTAYLASEKGAPEATAIGFSHLLPVTQAAFINGLLARYAEFDDMAMPDLHPSGVIFPVVLSLAETRSCSGKEMLLAFALGVELCIRLARAGYDSSSRNSRFLKRGQDSTAICGAVGGAVAAAKLLGLDAEKMGHAIAIAVSFASGSIEANRTGGSIKQLQSGWAAKSALQAAFLAKYGITGPVLTLEGRYGFYQCFIDGEFDAKVLTNHLGSEWLLSTLRYKPYPSNYYTHAGIDAALALRQVGLRPDQIESIHLEVALPMFKTVGEPIERKRQPPTPYEAKFSAPYTVATALLGGSGLGVGLEDFTLENIRDTKRLTLMQKITISTSTQCNAIFPDHAPAILTITTQQGEQHIKEIFLNRGSPENPLSESELALKFKTNAAYCIKNEKVIEQLYNFVNEIDKLPNMTPLFEIVRNIHAR